MHYLTKKIMRAHRADVIEAKRLRDERIVTLYAQGFTMEQIGRKRGINLTRPAVANILDRHGVAPRPRGRRSKPARRTRQPTTLARVHSLTSAAPAVPVSRINTHVTSLHDAVVALATELGVPLQLHGTTARRAG